VRPRRRPLSPRLPDDIDNEPDGDADGVPTDAALETDVDNGEPDADLVDGGGDVEADAELDVDAGPLACAESSTGTFRGFFDAATPVTVGGYVFDYNGLGPDRGSALFTITCGGSIVETDYTCPVGIETVINVPVDGRRLRITPTAAGEGGVNVGITVENL
jgi:hypothetical protein